jgi:hypothetical protein
MIKYTLRGTAALLIACGATQHTWSEVVPLPGKRIALDSRGMSVLMADDADGSKALRPLDNGGYTHKRLYMLGWKTKTQALSWRVDSSEDADYEAQLVSCNVPSVRVTGGSGGDLIAKIESAGWGRNPLGVIRLKRGENTITLQLTEDQAQDGALRSLDLLPVRAKPDYERRVAALRASAAWMRGPGYGVMLQYGGWAYPEHGPKKPWEEVVNAFDTEKFAKMVDEDMGARWVIWSITWRDSHFPMPLKSVDAIVPGHTTKRDLMADLAASLNKRNIKLMFYYHPGHEDQEWWAANWKDPNPKELFLKNWMAVVTEIGERYGNKLAGWFFDDACTYTPAPFEAMTKAAKTGNPGRMVSYNNWILPILTDFQDIQMGEGFVGNTETPVGSDGVYATGMHIGLQAHGMFCVNSQGWGIWQPEQKTPLTVNAERALQIVKEANRRGQLMSLNFDMYQDGVVTPQTLEMFRTLKSNVYKQAARATGE